MHAAAFSAEAAADYSKAIGRDVRVEEMQRVVNYRLAAKLAHAGARHVRGVTDPFPRRRRSGAPGRSPIGLPRATNMLESEPKRPIVATAVRLRSSWLSSLGGSRRNPEQPPEPD